MIEDFEKCALIAKYLYMTSFYIENEVTQAKNNLLNRQRIDAHALLEYHRQLARKEMYDEIFRDISRILYEWGGIDF